MDGMKAVIVGDIGFVEEGSRWVGDGEGGVVGRVLRRGGSVWARVCLTVCAEAILAMEVGGGW